MKTILSVCVQIALMAPWPSDAHAMQADLSGAVPTRAALSQLGFAQYRVRSHSDPGQGVSMAIVSAVRSRDELTLRVIVSVADTSEIGARRATRDSRAAQHGMLVGAPSGKKLAPEVWRSKYIGGDTPNGAFTLIAHDGRAITKVQIMLPPYKGKDGKVVLPEIAASDLRLSETLTEAAISELAKRGFTSTPPK